MSFHLVEAAQLVPIKKGPKSVLLALARHANRDGTEARPGMDRLVALTSLSERAVRDNLRRLEDMQLIEAVAYLKGGRGMTTVYTIDAARIYADAEVVEAALKYKEKAADSAGFRNTEGGRKRRQTRQNTTPNPAVTAPHSVRTLSDSVGLDDIDGTEVASVGVSCDRDGHDFTAIFGKTTRCARCGRKRTDEPSDLEKAIANVLEAFPDSIVVDDVVIAS